MAYSDAIKEAWAVCPSNEVVLDTLEIRHPSVVDVLYLVKNREALTLTLEDDTEHEFEPVGFRFALPPSGQDGTQALTIAVDNVDPDNRIINFLNSAKASQLPVVIKYRTYLFSDPTTPQNNPPLTLFLTDVTITLMETRGKAGFSDILNMKFPSQLYKRDKFPSIG